MPDRRSLEGSDCSQTCVGSVVLIDRTQGAKAVPCEGCGGKGRLRQPKRRIKTTWQFGLLSRESGSGPVLGVTCSGGSVEQYGADAGAALIS